MITHIFLFSLQVGLLLRSAFSHTSNFCKNTSVLVRKNAKFLAIPVSCRFENSFCNNLWLQACYFLGTQSIFDPVLPFCRHFSTIAALGPSSPHWSSIRFTDTHLYHPVCMPISGLQALPWWHFPYSESCVSWATYNRVQFVTIVNCEHFKGSEKDTKLNAGNKFPRSAKWWCKGTIGTRWAKCKEEMVLSKVQEQRAKTVLQDL